MEKGLSVVVCCYAGKETIASCLQSLSEQESSYQFEVILVDDGSTDGTKDVALDWITKYKGDIRFHQYCFDNRGLSFARNRGITISKFCYVAFIDEDAIADKNWVNEIVKTFEENSLANTVGGEVRLLNKGNRTAEWIYHTYAVPYMDAPSSIIGTNMSFKRSFLLDNSGFVTDFTYRGDETVFFKKTAAQVQPVRNNKIVVYHEQPESIARWLTIRYENGYFGAAADLYSRRVKVPKVFIKYIMSLVLGCLAVVSLKHTPVFFFVLMSSALIMVLYRRVFGSRRILKFTPSMRLIFKRYKWDVLGELYFMHGFLLGYLRYRKHNWEKQFEF